LDELNLFPIEEDKPKKQEKVELPESPLDYLYIKVQECPCCVRQFEACVVRKSKLRIISTETDLKTKYHTIDPNLYDVLLCTRCGYAALINYFSQITEKQKDMLFEKITPRYINKEYYIPFTLEDAVERYKVALLCAAVIGVKASQKAILCLKTAWIYRDLADNANEMLFIKNALTGFKEAYKAESFPFGAMDELTTKFIIGELSRRVGNLSEASKWISEVVTSRSIKRTLKDRALLIKDLIRAGTTT
jgi:hypothetical protein